MITKLKVVARVVFEDDYYVHILMANGESVFATLFAVFELFADPLYFLSSGYKQYQLSSNKYNGKKKPLEELLGFPIAVVYEDGSIDGVCNTIYKLALPYLKEKLPNAHIKLDGYLNKTTFSDLKELKMKQFADFIKSHTKDLRLESNIPIRQEHLDLMSVEFDKASYMFAPIVEEKKETLEILPPPPLVKERFIIPVIPDSEVDPSFVSQNEFADSNCINRQTMNRDVHGGVYKSAVKLKVSGRIYVDPNETPRIPRHKEAKSDSEGRSRIRAQGNSYEDTQAYIAERQLVSDIIRPFITDWREARYYRINYYREVEIQGRRCLICNIYPDYFCKEKGMYNRDLIKAGKNPVVPPYAIKDKSVLKKFPVPVYHVHHIGQARNSPFAIIPEYDHIGKMDSIFHPNPQTEDLHDEAFKVEKHDFLMKVLEMHDDIGGFKHIPYLNPLKEHKERTRRN